MEVLIEKNIFFFVQNENVFIFITGYDKTWLFDTKPRQEVWLKFPPLYSLRSMFA